MLCGQNMGPRVNFSWRAHGPQDFAMFELNNTCVLTIQLHFDFFRMIQLFQKPYTLRTIKKQTKNVQRQKF